MPWQRQMLPSPVLKLSQQSEETSQVRQAEDLQMIPLQHVEPLLPDLTRRQPRVLERYHRLVETNKESLVDALLLNLKQQLILPIPIRDRFRFEVWKPI